MRATPWKIRGEVYKLHLIPSGILYPGTQCLVGAGTVIDPKVLLEEIDGLKARGITCENLKNRSQGSYYYALAYQTGWPVRETQRQGGNRHHRPRYRPLLHGQSGRSGIRFTILVHPVLLEEKAKLVGEIKNLYLTKVYENRSDGCRRHYR